jgi:hypothetical protein
VRAKKSVAKIEVYEALYALNQGVEQFIRSLDVLQRAGLDLRYINGQKILVEEIRAGVNHKILGLMTEREKEDWARYEKKRLFSTSKSKSILAAN